MSPDDLVAVLVPRSVAEHYRDKGHTGRSANGATLIAACAAAASAPEHYGPFIATVVDVEDDLMFGTDLGEVPSADLLADGQEVLVTWSPLPASYRATTR